jgi:catechol 2,3-dioxygenase-like lactoylglutathione lyase family enzyme
MMHIAYYTDKMEEMVDFYTNKLGLELKVLVRFGIYKDRDDRPLMQKIAKEDPDRIFNVYIEMAPGQFIELFPKMEGQTEDTAPWNSRLGYSHYGLTCDDIFETRKKLEAAGVVFDTEISKGPSETYQMWTHDPDGNKFEIMQYTDRSFQVVGHIEK